jgi:hypothetical protein
MTRYKNTGPYLRIKVSANTITQGALFLGGMFQMVTGIDSVAHSIKLKKMVERRERLDNVIKNARVSTEIAASIAGAVSNLLKK